MLKCVGLLMRSKCKRKAALFLIILTCLNTSSDYLVPIGTNPIRKRITHLNNLCAPGGDGSCKQFENNVNNARVVCGGELEAEYNYKPKYTSVKSVQCKGQTCTVDVSTNDTTYHAVIECVQSEPGVAWCNCSKYGFSKWAK